MLLKATVVCGLLGIGVLGLTGSAVLAQNAPTAKQLFQGELAPVANQEAMIFMVEFGPGQSLPWHMHPDGHELAYVIEGSLTLEDQNQKKLVIKAGDANHIAPNVGHTARNDGTTVAKVLVVRIKDKSKPVTVPFQR